MILIIYVYDFFRNRVRDRYLDKMRIMMKLVQETILRHPTPLTTESNVMSPKCRL